MINLSHWFDLFMHWIVVNPEWIGWIIFFVVFTESMILVGLIVPGIAFMLAISGLIATGKVSFWMVYLFAVFGGIVGDTVSFWLGYRFQDAIRNLNGLKKRKQLIARGEHFFAQWGWLSIFIGRFFGPMRATVPLIAGMMKMNIFLFMLMNILSALVWVAVYFVPGWLATQV